MSESSKAVFLSYASQDAEAARRIADALRSSGVEVWFDQSELVGGDQWDAKIRGQIGSCGLFLPVISTATQARLEGYFRIEWKLAAQRTYAMAEAKPFLLPVVIDPIRDTEAHVPPEFRAVQWTRLTGGETPPAFAERVKKLLGGSEMETTRPRVAEHPSAGVSLVNPMPRRSWLVPAILGVIAILALALWQPWRRVAPLSTSASLVPTMPTASATEIARVRARIIPDRWQRQDFEAISSTLDRIILANPEEAEAWVLRSIINSLQVTRNQDSGTKPLEAGKAAAERALRLAPANPLGELALGMHLVAMVSRGGDVHAARAHIDRAVAGRPPDAMTRYAELVSYWQGFQFEDTERCARAWLAAEPSASFPALILALMNITIRRPAEAEKWAEQAATDKDVTGVRALAVMFDARYYLLANLPAARAALNRQAAGGQTAHRVVFARWLLAMAEHRWDVALQELARIPESILFDRNFHGPKALLAGLAHRAAGRPEAMAGQLREAERLEREELARDPDNEELHAVLALTLACAGQADGARAELATIAPLVRDRAPSVYTGQLICLVAETYAELGEPANLLPWLRKLFVEPSALPFTPASVRLNTHFGRVIDTPEVQALLKEFASLDQPAPASLAPSSLLPAPASPPPADAKSVAVLAFANLSDDKDNEYFSDGISEELLNVLAKIPGLKVTARTSSFYFKGKQVPMAEIARQLGVAYVVEGSVRKQGDKVRITAQLIKAADGFHVWSDTFTRELKDIFAVQDEIAGLIAQNLSLKLAESAQAKKLVNPDAYRLVLEGRHFWNLRTDEGFARAEAAYTKALTLDPNFAEAHAGLAEVYVIRGNFRQLEGFDDYVDDAKRAHAEARLAISLDPAMSEPYSALGFGLMLDGNLAESERQFQTALTLNPNSALAHCWHAELLTNEGRLDAALAEYERTSELDPLWFINLQVYARKLGLARRFSEALKMNERAAAMRSDIYIPNQGEQARILWGLDRQTEAIEVARLMRRRLDLRPRWTADNLAIRVLWLAGLKQEAANYATALFAKLPADSYLRGFALCAMNRFAEALPFLERTPVISVQELFWDETWDSSRHDPRFQQLMAKLGRTQDYDVARATFTRMAQEPGAKK